GWLLIIRRGKILPGPGSSIAPYAVLVLGTIAGQIATTWVPNGWQPIIASPAVYAFLGVAVALWQYRQPAPSLAGRAAGLWLKTGVPTALYILFGVVMQGGHIAQTLAQALAGLGDYYLLVMPLIGAMGGYMTASGTGTNAMFGPTQVAVGNQLSVDAQWSMAVNNAAGCWGSIASPARTELTYQLARGASMTDDGPLVTRAWLLAVTIPVLLASNLVWGIAAYLVLPGLPGISL